MLLRQVILHINVEKGAKYGCGYDATDESLLDGLNGLQVCQIIWNLLLFDYQEKKTSSCFWQTVWVIGGSSLPALIYLKGQKVWVKVRLGRVLYGQRQDGDNQWTYFALFELQKLVQKQMCKNITALETSAMFFTPENYWITTLVPLSNEYCFSRSLGIHSNTFFSASWLLCTDRVTVGVNLKNNSYGRYENSPQVYASSIVNTSFRMYKGNMSLSFNRWERYLFMFAAIPIAVMKCLLG